ncbi:MAG: BatD family protein [Longimicrobiales bacterium]|nr:BatD family protein [Longimicrobiales bacterium]
MRAPNTCPVSLSTLSLAALLSLAPAVAAQDPQAGPVVREATVSADTVEIGDRVELRFTVILGPGTVAFLPDSVDAGPVQSVEAVRWSADRGTNGRTEVSVTYPLIIFRPGSVVLPEIEVFAVPAAEATRAGLAGPDEVVGSWADFRAEPSAVSTAGTATVPSRPVQVRSVLVLDDLTTQIAPRPVADVLGSSRDWRSTTLLAVFGLTLLGIATVSARDWISERARVPPPPPPTPRERALEALDELLATGLHRKGDVRAFYAGWSDVIRRYVEGFDDEWGPSWTSTELMSDLQGRRRSLAIQRALTPDAIADEMRLAEEVKFGGRRPGPDAAETHLAAVRAWIRSSRPSTSAS